MSDSQQPHSLPGSCVHGIPQARVLEWVASNVYKITKEVFLAYYSIRILLHKRSKVLIAKFRLKLTKVGKTTRPCMYDLYQIPYAYTVEVTNKFKGLHLIDRVSEELWIEVCDIVQEAVIKTIPKEKKCKKA